jgi:uncharacterized membrane protein YcaP (DUF421 family)
MSFELLGLVLRVSVMYVYALALLRLSGKQSVRDLTAMDFIVTTIIGDLFDDVFWQEVPLLSGLVGFGTVMLVHILVCFLTSRNKAILRLVSPARALVIQNGRLLMENLQRERLRRETVLFEMRIQKEDDLESIQEARLEPSGECSFIKTKDSQQIRKEEIEHFQWGKPYYR